MKQKGDGPRRKRGRSGTTVGVIKNKRQPRSLGLTYAAVRSRLGLNQADMHAHLQAIRSDYPFPKAARRKEPKKLSRSEREQRDRQRRHSMASRWEGPRGNPVFSVSHRYGVASQTYSGVLDLTSLVYAELRNAGQAADPAVHLENIHVLAAQLVSFAETIATAAKNFAQHRTEHRLDASLGDRDAYQLHLDLINLILDGFRKQRAKK